MKTHPLILNCRTKGVWAVKVAHPIIWFVSPFSFDLAVRIGNWALSQLRAEYQVEGDSTWRVLDLPHLRMFEE